LTIAALLLVLGACSGGQDFTTATPFDAGAIDASGANDAADSSVGNIILNPNDNGGVDASVDTSDDDVGTDASSGDENACNVSYVRCGKSCVDLHGDANNCGRCDHSCLGAPCQSGVCQSWVIAAEKTQTALLSPQRGGLFAHSELVTDGKNVVWIDGQAGVLETSATGGPSPPIINIAPISATGAVGFGNLAIANGLAVWTMWDSNNGVSVWKATATGKSTDAVTGVMVGSLGATTAGDAPSGMGVDATAANTYFIDSITMNGTAPSNPGLFTCVVATGSCARLTATGVPTSLAFANDVTAAGGRVFFTDSHGSINQYLGNYQTTAGPSMRLAVDSTYLYWVETVPAEADGGTNDGFQVHRAPMSNIAATAQLVLPAQKGLFYAMATDGTNLYFSNNGALEYIPVSGNGAPHPLKSGQQAYAIAAGGGAIYWVDGDGTIDGIAAP
jgi:hypothetical protein